MIDTSLVANCVLVWLCCLQPIIIAIITWNVARYGVRGSLSMLLDHLGVPPLQ